MVNKKTSKNKGKEPSRDENGRLIGGGTANPKGRPKGRFNYRTLIEARLKGEVMDLIDEAINEAKNGSNKTKHKVLIFLLSKILPNRPMMESIELTKMTSSSQQNLINVFQNYSSNHISTDEANNQLGIVQKQIEIQQSDFVKLQDMITDQSKVIEELRIQLNEKRII